MELVDQICASSNQILFWLRQIAGLRSVGLA